MTDTTPPCSSREREVEPTRPLVDVTVEALAHLLVALGVRAVYVLPRGQRRIAARRRLGHRAVPGDDGCVLLLHVAHLRDALDPEIGQTLEDEPAKIVQTIAWREEGGEPPRAVGDVDPLTGLARFEGVAMEFEATAATAPSVADESRRGRRGPTRSDLEHFAQVYLGFYRAGKPDPVKQTTRALNISRATAHRRIDQARALGLIAPREEHE